jgi:hypothetical protein
MDLQESAFWPPNDPALHCLLGFRYGRRDFPAHGLGGYEFAVPYWFLIVASSAVLFSVWRKTRPKSNPATAFPVEVKASGGI